MKRITIFSIFLTLMLLPSCAGRQSSDQVRFDEANSSVPVTENMLYNRCIVWRPADGTTVALNPPRFSWPYEPTIMLDVDSVTVNGLPIRQYSFQIAADDQFGDVLFEVERTPFNFYNAIPSLPGGKQYFWRVGYYNPEDANELVWQKTRSFEIGPGAAEWDRAGLDKPAFSSEKHPRIIYTEERIGELRALADTDPDSRVIFERTIEAADEAITTDWYASFPASDTIPREQLCALYADIPEVREPYLMIIDRLMYVCFAWVLTGDDKYLSVVERMVAVASYGPTGITRPEGMPGVGGRARPDNVELNEDLALFYDWFYHQMSAGQRRIVLKSLRWRTEYIMYSYSWRRNQGKRVSPNSVVVAGSSHPYENLHYTLPAGLAAYESGGVFKETYEFAVHWLSGINNCFGPEGTWNEGPGYGLSKLQWMIYAISYYDMTLEGANFGRNPFLNSIGDFFTRVAVLGLPHLSFGNIGIRETYYVGNKMSSFRKMAYMTGNRRFLTSWTDAARRMEQLGSQTSKNYSRPWIEYALPLLYPHPRKLPPTPKARLFPDGGWVTAASKYPGELDNYADAVGIVFHARPRGAYNHSFFGDNNFQLYAYGQNITHAGAGTQNKDRLAYHSMSQNVVLVDGLGQAQPEHTSMRNFRLGNYPPYIARIARFADTDYVQYFKGEAADAYPRYPYHYKGFWGFLGDGTSNPYHERDLRYLTKADRHVLLVDGRYFVILDDLEVSRPEGSTFSWLYHVLQDVPLEWDSQSGRFSYKIEDVTTLVQHMSAPGELQFADRQKEDGFSNPLTGEDYTQWVIPIQNYNKNHQGEYPDKVTHNVWISNRQPRQEMRFMVVVYPVREGMPMPKIERVDDLTAKVSWQGKVETVTFAPQLHPDAEIQVEL